MTTRQASPFDFAAPRPRMSRKTTLIVATSLGVHAAVNLPEASYLLSNPLPERVIDVLQKFIDLLASVLPRLGLEELFPHGSVGVGPSWPTERGKETRLGVSLPGRGILPLRWRGLLANPLPFPAVSDSTPRPNFRGRGGRAACRSTSSIRRGLDAHRGRDRGRWWRGGQKGGELAQIKSVLLIQWRSSSSTCGRCRGR